KETATGAPGMPQNLVTGQDADDVATYVAKCAAVPSCGVNATGGAAPPPTTTGGGGGGGGGGGSGGAQGRQTFASAGCNSCHTLKAAGASGTTGPNLDDLKPDQETVAKQVTNGGGVMPAFKGKLTAAQIQAVAKYVSTVAGK